MILGVTDAADENLSYFNHFLGVSSSLPTKVQRRELTFEFSTKISGEGERVAYRLIEYREHIPLAEYGKRLIFVLLRLGDEVWLGYASRQVELGVIPKQAFGVNHFLKFFVVAHHIFSPRPPSGIFLGCPEFIIFIVTMELVVELGRFEVVRMPNCFWLYSQFSRLRDQFACVLESSFVPPNSPIAVVFFASIFAFNSDEICNGRVNFEQMIPWFKLF